MLRTALSNVRYPALCWARNGGSGLIVTDDKFIISCGCVAFQCL